MDFLGIYINGNTRCGFGCCIIGFVLSFFMVGFYIARDVERGCVDA